VAEHLRDLAVVVAAALAVVACGAGGTVRWTNEDDVTHTVTFDDGPDSGDLAGGAIFEHAFDEPGDHGYVCTIHAGMAAGMAVTVTVAG
jgi:plastocyanin